MPVDDRDERSSPSPQESAQNQSAATPSEEASAAETPAPVVRQRRRFFNQRNAIFAALALAGIILLLLFALFVFYRSGQLDNILAEQIKRTLATYGIRAEIESTRVKFSPRTVEMRNIALYDATSGDQIGRVNRLEAKVRIEDLWALNLRRNVDLEELSLEGLEAWIAFDAEGRSNFRNLKLPPPDPNRRILFSYSTAKINLKDSVIHYGDAVHRLSGEARNVNLSVQPDDPNAPAESWMNRVALSLANSSFAYDDRTVKDISLEARGRVNQTRAEIEDLTLRSPVAEAHAKGVMDDWRNLKYQLDFTSSVDLTQLSDVLQGETALRGAGRVSGTIKGSGTSYQIENGRAESDALAADGVRLKGLSVNATGSGDGATYQAQGRAVAELLTAGDYQINAVQLAGKVMGTGTDFRWLGELRAAAAKQGKTSIAGLILSDVAAEIRDAGSDIKATIGRAQAASLNASGARVNALNASRVHVTTVQKGASSVNNVTVAEARAGSVAAQGVNVSNVTASGIKATTAAGGGATNVTVDRLQAGGATTMGARTGSLNIAGVRLAIFDNGRVQGSSDDIGVGTITMAGNDHIDNVRLAKPVFAVEPAGRYRVSADLSLGGGVLGQMKLGSARAGVVATNSQVQLNNFNADLFNGRASGNATIALSRNAASRVAADFNGLDVGGMITLLTGRSDIGFTGATTGSVDLTFSGINFENATGRLNAQLQGATGDETRGRTPVTGDVALRADNGLFQIERANLQTQATNLTASGQFSFTHDSNLQINATSTDAAELRRLLGGSGVAPDVEEKLNEYGVELGGKLAFNGTLTGPLSAPSLNGQTSIDSFLLQGRNLGTLAAAIETTPTEVRIRNGRLTGKDGGGVQFSIIAPLDGSNNGTIEAALDRADGGNLAAALPGIPANVRMGLAEIQSPLSGRINVTGFPGAMAGSADLKFGPGSVRGEQIQGIDLRANFSGSTVTLDNLDARLKSGRLTASGTVDTKTQAFDVKARGENINLSLLETLAGGAVPPKTFAGAADLTASATGRLSDPSSYQITFDGSGRDVTINGRPAGTLSLVGRTVNQQLDIKFTTGLLGQPQVIAARVDLSNKALPATIETSLNNADLTPLFSAILPTSGVRVTGRATGTLRAVGNLFSENAQREEVFSLTAGLRGTANLTDLTIQIADTQLSAVSPLLVQFSPDEIFFERTQFTGPGTNVTFGGTAALTAAGRQNLSVDGKLNLRVLNSISPDVFLAGGAEVSVRVTGTNLDPRLSGTASVAGASFSTLITTQRLSITNINGRVRFTSNAAQIESLTGLLGGGRVEVVSGGALLSGLRPSQYRVVLRGRDFTIPFPQNFSSTADADIEIRGTMESRLVEGLVSLRRAQYTENIDLADLINQRREGSLEEGTGGETLAATTQLDLRVEGRDALVVRNNLADLVGSVSLRIGGTVNDEVISGRITSTRGTINFRNDRYELTRALIDLPPRRDADPVLNIQAESEIRGYRVIVGLNGELSKLQANVRSEPSLPQADVVSLITTGTLSTGDASASSLAQSGFGTATTLLTDTIINAPVRRATDRLFGLNRFEIDPLVSGKRGSSPTARLTVGRQINRNLSVTYSTNFTADQNQVVALEYRVSDRVSFVAQYEQGSQSGLNPHNNNFSFEIRFRKRF